VQKIEKKKKKVAINCLARMLERYVPLCRSTARSSARAPLTYAIKPRAFQRVLSYTP